MRQRARVVRDLDELKKGPSKKTEEEQLKKVENDMAEYVAMRPTDAPAQVLIKPYIDFAFVLSAPSPKTPSTPSSKTPRRLCGNSTSLSTTATETSSTAP